MSTFFEKLNTDLKSKYLRWNIVAFNITAKKVSANRGSFGISGEGIRKNILYENSKLARASKEERKIEKNANIRARGRG